MAHTNSPVQISEESSHLNKTIYVSLLSVLVGIVAGFGAVGFRYLIGFFHNLFFYGTFSFFYDSEVPFVSRWGLFVVLVPALGIALANWITEKWAPEAKGHGVPEVMVAVMEERGVIRPVVALVKSLASAITIGAGGSVGREGPIVQIGASFGSTLGQVLKLSPREVIILVGAGVAGSIGATFNAPIGGIIFAIELILPEYSIMTIMPLVISSTIATHVSLLILGNSPAFTLPMYQFVSTYELSFYLVLGVLAGFVSIGFISVLYKTEDFFDELPINSTVKALAGGALVGLIGYVLFRIFGEYYVYGVGYAFLTEVLANSVPIVLLLLVLLAAKIAANALTLAAGGSGGIFAPSLFLGAAVGAIVGLGVKSLFPELTACPSAYAIVGMAAVVAGTTGASLTAIIMIFEMTRNYEIMLPLMLSVVVAHFITAKFYRETIYTKKLTRRGIKIQLDKRIPIFRTVRVGDIMKTDLVSCNPASRVGEVSRVMHENGIGLMPVIHEGQVIGTISYEELFRSGCRKEESIKSLFARKEININLNSDLYEALNRMKKERSNLLVVTDVAAPAGFVTRNMIISSYLVKREGL
ncbi:chloride channel protein [Marispirochaeta sp.]|uniref:chloride channel protein n=1 Tax=Marispirochaeta sp. TaxID=2038653 RepID=UPI0029C6C182|nr:chloride channel protein [Marispirochaeta sp.]